MFPKRFALIAIVALAAAFAVTPALAAGGLTGKYKTRIGAKDLRGQLKGTWTIAFKKGAYTVTDNGTAVIHGKYSVKGSKVTLGHETGPRSCSASGTYRFKLTGKTMKFTRVNDSKPVCTGRQHVLAHTFTKVG